MYEYLAIWCTLKFHRTAFAIQIILDFEGGRVGKYEIHPFRLYYTLHHDSRACDESAKRMWIGRWASWLVRSYNGSWNVGRLCSQFIWHRGGCLPRLQRSRGTLLISVPPWPFFRKNVACGRDIRPRQTLPLKTSVRARSKDRRWWKRWFLKSEIRLHLFLFSINVHSTVVHSLFIIMESMKFKSYKNE